MVLVKSDNKVMTPIYMPEPPNPQTARPPISVFMSGAAAHRVEPSSNRATQRMYTHFASYWVYIWPLTIAVDQQEAHTREIKEREIEKGVTDLSLPEKVC